MMSSRSWRTAVGAVALALVTGCGASPDPAARPDPKTTPSSSPSSAPSSTPSNAPSSAAPARVVALSIDGLNPTALTQLGASRLPNFRALVRDGASTLNARTEVEMTTTLPNHTGMLTGRPVAGARGHRVDFNDDSARTTVSAHAGRTIASVFDVAHDAGRSTAFYASKTKFALFERTWATSLDRTLIRKDNDRLVARLVAELGAGPADLSFVHLSAPDDAGHATGFMGAAYLRAVEHVDVLLGRIRRALSSSPDLRRRTYLIVTADHGGRGLRGHSAVTKLDDYRIPFLVTGPGVTPGSDLYDLNEDRRDPGTGRPSYAGRQPVRNGDLANLATRLLGLGPVPGSVFGVEDPLDVR